MESNFEEQNEYSRPNVEQPIENTSNFEKVEQPKPQEQPVEQHVAPAPIPETETQRSIQEVSKVANNAIQDYQKTGTQIVAEKLRKGEVDANKAGKDLAHLAVTAEVMQDNEENKEFRDKFKDVKEQELISSARESLAKQEADRLAAKQKKAEAFYVSYRPILEFDLDHLLVRSSGNRIKYTKVYSEEKRKMIKVPVEPNPTEEQEPIVTKPKHTYEERSYGIPLMVMMLCVLTIPYFAATVVLACFNMINYIFVAISKFSKPAFYICTGIAGITLLGIFIYVVLLCIQSAFNVQIIPEAVAVAETISMGV
jgi:hypothetical protein